MRPGQDDNQDEVDRHVANRMMADPALLVAQQRGMLDVETAAKQLVEEHDWDARKRDVVRAIRTFELPGEFDIEAACQLLDDTPIEAGNGLALLEVGTDTAELDGVPSLCELLEGKERFGLSVESEAMVIVPDRLLSAAIEVLDASPDDVREGLSYVDLKFAKQGPRTATAMCVVLQLLEREDVEVVKANKAASTLTLIIPAEEQGRAVHLIQELGRTYSDQDDNQG